MDNNIDLNNLNNVEATTPVVEIPAVTTPVVNVTPTVATPVVETPVVTTPVVEIPAVTTPVVEMPAATTPVVEIPAATTPVVEIPAATTPVVEIPAATTPVVEIAPATAMPEVTAPTLESVPTEMPSFDAAGATMSEVAPIEATPVVEQNTALSTGNVNVDVAATTSAPIDTTSIDTTQGDTPKKSKTGMIVIIVLAVLAIAAVLVFYVIKPFDKPNDEPTPAPGPVSGDVNWETTASANKHDLLSDTLAAIDGGQGKYTRTYVLADNSVFVTIAYKYDGGIDYISKQNYNNETMFIIPSKNNAFTTDITINDIAFTNYAEYAPVSVDLLNEKYLLFTFVDNAIKFDYLAVITDLSGKELTHFTYKYSAHSSILCGQTNINTDEGVCTVDSRDYSRPSLYILKDNDGKFTGISFFRYNCETNLIDQYNVDYKEADETFGEPYVSFSFGKDMDWDGQEEIHNIQTGGETFMCD